MTVEKVVLYRSVDQELHQTEQACLARNFALQTRPQVMALIEKHGNKTGSGVAVEAMNVEEICDFILSATPELVALLQPLVSPLDAPRRARRTKAELTLEKAAKAVLENKAQTQATPTPVARPATAVIVAATHKSAQSETGEIGSLSSNADAFAHA